MHEVQRGINCKMLHTKAANCNLQGAEHVWSSAAPHGLLSTTAAAEQLQQLYQQLHEQHTCVVSHQGFAAAVGQRPQCELRPQHSNHGIGQLGCSWLQERVVTVRADLQQHSQSTHVTASRPSHVGNPCGAPLQQMQQINSTTNSGITNHGAIPP